MSEHTDNTFTEKCEKTNPWTKNGVWFLVTTNLFFVT